MEFKRLKYIREERELKQKDVAKMLNISLGTYAMNETAHDTITLKNLIKFCDIFNVSVDYMFEFTNTYNYKNTKNGFDKNILRKRLKECRLENNYTQIMMGNLLNIDHSVWCRYELGTTTITSTFLYYFCREFHISADYLLGKIDNPKYLKN